MNEFEKDEDQMDEEVAPFSMEDDDDPSDFDAFEYDDEEVDEEAFDDEAFEDDGLENEEVSDIDVQADAMIDGIKSDSTYSLHTETDAENFDPDEAPANAIVDSEDVGNSNEVSSSISEGDDVEELPDSIDITVEDIHEGPTFDPIEDAKKAARSRKRLRNLLIFFIVILVLLAAALCFFVWRNNTPPDVKVTDPDDMRTSRQAGNTEIFIAIPSDQIPELVSYFGLTPEEAAEQSGGTIALDTEAQPAADAAFPELKSTRNGWVVNKSGDIAVSITFGLNQDSKIIYALATFDLDAYGIADAKFDELAASQVVAASILSGIGLDEATVGSAEITVVTKPDAVTSRDTAGKEVAEFSGSTGRDAAPKEWKLTETYDHTAGASLGDNSVIRTLTVDLK